MNGRLGTVFKILHFALKSEWRFGYNCKISYFPVKKATGRLGIRIVNDQNIVAFILLTFNLKCSWNVIEILRNSRPEN